MALYQRGRQPKYPVYYWQKHLHIITSTNERSIHSTHQAIPVTNNEDTIIISYSSYLPHLHVIAHHGLHGHTERRNQPYCKAGSQPVIQPIHHHITSHGENGSRPQRPLYPRNNDRVHFILHKILNYNTTVSDAMEICFVIIHHVLIDTQSTVGLQRTAFNLQMCV